jgi:hypothetical protein
LVANFSGTEVNCLLDTGATSSVIHPNRFYAIPEESRPRLEGKAGSLEVADGFFVASHGSAVLTFTMGGQEIRHRFAVADLVAPAILGLDFLKANHAFVDVCGADIWVNGQRIGCLPQKDGVGVFKVALRETITIPPLSEIILEAEAQGAPTYTCALVEPCLSFMSSKHVLLAKSVVDPSGGTFPLRVVNLEDKPVTLYRKTIAGTCVQVEEVEQVATDRVATIVTGNSDKHIPRHLADVWAGLEGTLTGEQHSKVQGLLTKHQRTFAMSKEDIGRTHLVQHKIPTGEARPIVKIRGVSPLPKGKTVPRRSNVCWRWGLSQRLSVRGRHLWSW